MRQLYLGVDGGGTRCRMRLADENLKTLGEVITQTPSNLQLRNGNAAYDSIIESTPQVFAQAGIDIGEAANTHACFGMAGARLKSAREAFAARQFPFNNVTVYDDVDIARAGAHEGEDGAVLIIGTGSAGLGMLNGQRLQIGGWGFLVGDAMSGAMLGRELLRKSLMAHEEIVPGSPLTKAVMALFENDAGKLMEWSFENPDALADTLNPSGPDDAQSSGGIAQPPPASSTRHARPTDYGKFVPLIFDYLEQDDAMAKELLQFEFGAIDTYIDWFVKRGITAIAIVGGLGQRLLPNIKQRYGDVIVDAKSGPLHGALILARHALKHG